MLPGQIQRGLALVNQAPREAVQHFRQLLKDHPQDVEVVHGHARALIAYASQASNDKQRKSFLEKAKAELEKVTELDDLHATAFDELQELDETLSRLSVSSSSTGTGSGIGSGTGNPSPMSLGDPGELKTVSGQTVKLEAQIGQGSYGVVYRGTCGGLEVAVKRFAVMQLSQKQLDEFVKETGIMRSVRSPYVMACRDVITLPNYYGLVMDYMAKGSLWHWLHNPQAPLGWEQQYQIARDITEGLSALHYHNVIHRDLKSLNVLVDKDDRAKLADFGLSKTKTNSSNSKSAAVSFVGTLAWLAPEIIRDSQPHTFASDMYSLGLVIWELSTRQQPFMSKDAAGIMRTKMLTQHETIPNNCPPRFAQLIWQCWQNRPQDRPSARNLVDRLAQSSDPFAIDSAPNLITSFPANAIEDTPWEPQQQPIMPAQIPLTSTKPPAVTPPSPPAPASPAGHSQSPHLLRPLPKQPAATAFERVKGHSEEIKQAVPDYRSRDQKSFRFRCARSAG